LHALREALSNPANHVLIAALTGGDDEAGLARDENLLESGVSGYTGATTARGAEHLAAAGFGNFDVALIEAGHAYQQGAGGTAYVVQTGRDSYNLIVENERGAVVTAHRGMTLDDLSGLARNCRWADGTDENNRSDFV
jgi:hypothetical protein